MILTLLSVVRGPEEPTVVREKAKIGGIWVNDASMIFENAPGYYAVAASPFSVANCRYRNTGGIRDWV